MRGTRIQNIVDELNGEKIDVVEWHSDVRFFISNALSPARPTDTILIEEGEVRTAIVVVPDRQLSLAIGKEGQNARLAAKLTGWRIDIKSETEAATEGLNEIKRQQLQMMRARTLESKVPAAAGDDLLSRAEWLLREKDRSAVTLDQAAQLLADAEAEEAVIEEATAVASEEPAVVVEEAVAPVAEAEPATEPQAQVEAEAAAEPTEAPAEVAEPSFGEIIFEELDLAEFDETEDAEGAGKAGKGKKTGKGQRELVYDDRLGQVVSRKKRKPGRQGWEDEIESY
jgi:N utilization substance protein A